MTRLEDGLDEFDDAALHVRVIGNRPCDRHIARPFDGHTLADQRAGIDEQPRTHAFLQPVILEVSHFPAQLDQARCNRWVHTGFTLDNGGFDLG